MDRTYTAPAEWSRHSATQLHWPANQEKWTVKELDRVEEVYCNIIEELHFFEPIHLFVENLKIRNRVMQRLSTKAVDLDRVIIHQHKVNDVWARDYGPVFVKSEGEYLILDGQYLPLERDSNIPKYVAQKFDLQRIDPGMKLESGRIDINGAGSLLTTESHIIDFKGNPGLSKEQVEEKLKKFAGTEQIIWLKSGLAGQETQGYVDTVARWLNRNTVLAMITDDKSDENYELLQQNLDILNSVKMSDGNSLRVETLTLTKFRSQVSAGNDYLTDYTNFYIANGVVLVPLYNQEYDEKALMLFKKYFPGRKVIGIKCRDILRKRGTIHAITQPWYGL